MIRLVMLLSVLASVAACRDGESPWPRYAPLVEGVPSGCAVPLDPNVAPLPYVGVGPASMAEGFAPRRCAMGKPCRSDTALAETCALDPEAKVTVLGIRADGFVGQVRRFDAGGAGCADFDPVWLPRQALNETTLELVSDIFPDRCSPK